MKLTAFILLAACMQVAANGKAQLLTLSEKNASLETVFKEIKKQTGYDFFYKENDLSSSNRVSISVRNASIEEVLNICFKDQPLTYTIIEKTILVKKKEDKSQNGEANTLNNLPPPIDVTGKVTDADGNPLAGATVKVKGTMKGITTDVNGMFLLKGIEHDAVLEISYVGYVMQEIPVNSQKVISLSLKRNEDPLDQVQVIAYGQTTRRFQIGNVSTVKGEDIEKQPVNNVLLALEGRVPGLFVSQLNGFSGGAVRIRIQGQNSIANGNDPLYIIDGVPYTNQLLPNLGFILGSSSAGTTSVTGNPFSFINKGDIESVSVLKDADATAIYGSRGANGVILITTKKGKPGRASVDLDIQNGWGKITHELDVLNTKQYLTLRHEAFRNDRATPGLGDYDINGVWDTTRNTDWQKLLIGGTSSYLNMQANVSGGTSIIQYTIGGNYHRETTVLPGSFSDQKGGAHFSLRTNSMNQKFLLQLTTNYTIDNNSLPYLDVTSQAITYSPDAPSVYNADGSLNWQPNPSGTSTWTNPLAALNSHYQSKTSNLITNAIAELHILPSLKISSSFGYTDMQSNDILVNPLTVNDPATWYIGNSLRNASYANNTINSWIAESQFIYDHKIGAGRLEAFIGGTVEQNTSIGQQLHGNSYTSDLLLKDIQSAGTVTVTSTINSIYKYNALFARINYSLLDKYLIDLNARRDGSSRFGPQSQFHDFEAAGISWIFSKNRFFKNQLSFLSFGKIKASYGTTGSDQIGDYQFMDLYNSIGVAVPYQNATSLQIIQLYSPNLQWENTKKLAAGIDLGLFDNKVLLNATFFRNRSSNQLLQYGLPFTTGATFVLSNLPAEVQNSGWEISLSTINIKAKNFSWTTVANLTIPENKLRSFPNLASSGFANSLVVGAPITLQKVYHLLGVDPATGIYRFGDSHGNPTSSPVTGDKNILINTSPCYYGGIENTILFKRFQLDFLLQLVNQVGRNYLYFVLPGYFSANGYNQPASVFNQWLKPGDAPVIQRFTQSPSNGIYAAYSSYASSSDLVYSDASYLRLKNISLSWQFPSKWTKKVDFHNCQLYLQGQNLLTITNYKGMDPENGINGTGTSASLPPLRVLTIGIHVTL